MALFSVFKFHTKLIQSILDPVAAQVCEEVNKVWLLYTLAIIHQLLNS